MTPQRPSERRPLVHQQHRVHLRVPRGPARVSPAHPRCARQPSAPPPPRTKWTRRVPHPVLIGHAASLGGARETARVAQGDTSPAGARGARRGRGRDAGRTQSLRRSPAPVTCQGGRE